MTITLKAGDKVSNTIKPSVGVTKAVVASSSKAVVSGKSVITAVTDKSTAPLNEDHLALEQVNSAGVSSYVAGI